jgi:hypothetical protein
MAKSERRTRLMGVTGDTLDGTRQLVGVGDAARDAYAWVAGGGEDAVRC